MIIFMLKMEIRSKISSRRQLIIKIQSYLYTR